MKRKFVLGITTLCAAMTFTMAAQAQTVYKKSTVTREIKANLKASAFDKVVNNVNDAFNKYPATTTSDPELYNYRMQGYEGLIKAEEQKMYLKSKSQSVNPDTAKYFSLLNSLISDAYICDSICQTPDSTGKVKNPYRKQMLGYLKSNFSKFLSSVGFSYNHGSYDLALTYAKTCLAENELSKTAGVLPLQLESNPVVVQISSLAVLSAYSQKKFADVAHYMPLALNDVSKTENLMEMAVEAYTSLADSTQLEKTLLDGWKKFPQNQYFFLQLVKYYTDHNKYYPALDIVTEQTKLFPDDRDIWFVRGNEESYLDLTDQAIASFTKCTEIKPDDVDSYLAIGHIYLERSHKLYDKEKSAPLSEKIKMQQQMNETNRLALSAFESVRKYRPDDSKLWYSELKELYFKLNKGAELRALERMKK